MPYIEVMIKPIAWLIFLFLSAVIVPVAVRQFARMAMLPALGSPRQLPASWSFGQVAEKDFRLMLPVYFGLAAVLIISLPSLPFRQNALVFGYTCFVIGAAVMAWPSICDWLTSLVPPLEPLVNYPATDLESASMELEAIATATSLPASSKPYSDYWSDLTYAETGTGCSSSVLWFGPWIQGENNHSFISDSGALEVSSPEFRGCVQDSRALRFSLGTEHLDAQCIRAWGSAVLASPSPGCIFEDHGGCE